MLPPFDAGQLDHHQPDAHWVVIDSGTTTARCSLWWNNTPGWSDQRVGLIGHFAAADDRAADLLLKHALQELQERHCMLAVGPMDGNTWRDYRFVTERGTTPPFFMEPQNFPQWPAQFLRHGFRECASYFSAVVDNPGTAVCRVAQAGSRLERAGLRIRSLREDQYAEDMRGIYQVVSRAFRENLLFSEMGEAEFLQQFAPLRGTVPSELILLAEHSDRVVGFCFAVPDLLQEARGERIDTVVLKTLGVVPGRQYAGLGQVLLEQLHERARESGFRRVIHALVRDTPHLHRISRRYAVPIRRYSLFSREPGP